MNEINPINTNDIPTEEDMGKVRQIFDRAVNALVDASALRGEVETLRASIAQAQADITKVRTQNDWLDEQLVRIRGERDTAVQDAYGARQDQAIAQSSLHQSCLRVEDLDYQVGRQGEAIVNLKREREDAEMRVMELEDKLKVAMGKIEKFLRLADDIDPPEEPELAKPQAMAPVLEPWTGPVPGPVLEPSAATPTADDPNAPHKLFG